MKKVILIFVTIVLSGLLYAKDNKSTDALLREIDGIIKNRRTYGVEKETRIADLKRLLAEATSDEQRYGFCGRLFDEYRAYNLDSSFVYAQRKEELAHRMDKLDYLDDAAMNMAEVMGTTGMYKEALELLGQIDKKTLPDYLYGYYYHLYRTIYGLMGDYAVTEKVKKEYYRMTDLYRDSLLQVNASDSLGHVLVMADKCIVHAQYDEAIRLLDEGIEIAKEEIYPGTDSKWLEIKLKIYETTNRTSEVIDTCRLLFVTGRDKLTYYNKLKTLIPKEQWKSFLDAMMKETEFSNYFSFGGSAEADIYVKEQDNERLFTLLSSTRYDQLEALMRYAHYLKDTHSEQLIAMYTSSLNDYAERKMGRRNYEFIAQVLPCIHKLKGGQTAVKNIVAEFRIKYKRRPAMMEVLKDF